MLGVFNGVVLSNLKSVDLSSTRNLAIIGTSLLVGLMVPHWVQEYKGAIDTGEFLKISYRSNLKINEDKKCSDYKMDSS